MSALACCYQGCGASVCFTPEVERRLRTTHEWWVCPFGHRQHFVAETDQEVRARHALASRDRWRRRYEDAVDVMRACPFCDWRSQAGIDRVWMSMLRHFAKAHGVTLKGGHHPVFAMYQARKDRAA